MAQRVRPGLMAEQKREMWSRWKAGQSLSEIGRALGVFEREQGALRHFGEIDLPARLEHELQLPHRSLQQFGDRFEHLPLLVGVGSGRKPARVGKRGA